MISETKIIVTVVSVVSVLVTRVGGAGPERLDPGVHVKTVGESCQMGKYKIGPQSAMMLESANFNTQYASKLNCKVDRFLSNIILQNLRFCYASLTRKLAYSVETYFLHSSSLSKV